jgi:hypothetical protein
MLSNLGRIPNHSLSPSREQRSCGFYPPCGPHNSVSIGVAASRRSWHCYPLPYEEFEVEAAEDFTDLLLAQVTRE